MTRFAGIAEEAQAAEPEDAIERLRLARTEGVGPSLYRRLIARFGSADAALDALPEISRVGGRAAPLALASRDAAERERDIVARAGGRLVFLDTDAYPAALAMLPDAPPVLAVQGDARLLGGRAVGIVGSRQASANGRAIAETLAEALARAGLVVVSGLARGVDAAAHVGAMRSGATVACIATGIDVAYPPENAVLQSAIAERGAVVAEMPPGTQPLARHFPRRNRLIAGLALGIVVIEAAQRSGSLITARLALEAGRELFAVPGSPLDARCLGSNDLIRQGAHLTETAADVLANLPDHPAREGLARDPLFSRAGDRPSFSAPAPLPLPAVTDTDRDAVACLLSAAPTLVDDLIRRCHLSAPATLSALLELELAGRVQTVAGNRVALLSSRAATHADRIS